MAASRKLPVALVVFVALTSSLGATAAAAPTFAVDGTAAAPNPVAPGATTVISTGITATSETAFGIVVDLEVYSAGGVQVLQQVTSSDFPAGQRLGFQWTWAVPAGLAPGTYTVKLGIFSGDWSALYLWENNAASLAVAAGGPPPVTLTVTRTGSGTVTSAPAGISCGGDCAEPYPPGTAVTLTAAPATGWRFTGWSGGGCSGTAPCTVTVTASTTVAATFVRTFTLAVTRAGAGSGTVASAPAGIDCGSDCSEPYPTGTAVTLTATAAAGSAFAGWSGGGCSGTGPCTVTVTAATTVTATFALAPSGPFTLTVARAGAGSGAVASAPPGIDCGADCTEPYAGGTVVTLTATAAAGSAFAGWSGGGCSGTGACAVTVTAATTVTAAFALAPSGPFTLTVTRAGSGTGTVASAPPGIDCGADCAEPYAGGTVVTLTATAAAGSAFAGWSGGGCSGTGACAVTVTAATAVTATFMATGANPIVTENQRPGSSGWRIGWQVSDDWNKQIKGYASSTSVAHGGTIGFHVTVNPAQTYTLDVYRVGWYGGAGGRQLLHVGPLDGNPQPDCPPDGTTGLIECAWTVGYTLTVPANWTTGVYLGVLTNAEGWQSYVTFVVRDDARVGALLYQQSVTTYQAYNNYPNDGWSGKSLYGFNSYGPATMGGDTRAVKVSFDRPYADFRGTGQFLAWEVYFIRWLERSGYDVTYSTDLDTHQNGARLRTSRGFLSVGHDEYWSSAMFDAARSARDAGVSLGFFGADIAYWQVRFEPSASGVADRVMVCYKDGSLDPVDGPGTTIRFRDPEVGRPEQTLRGVQTTSYVPWGQNVPFVVVNSGHPIFAGTGFQDGDSVVGIVGYEMDRYMDQFPGPGPGGGPPTILGQSPFIDVNGAGDYANTTIYQAASGAWVFSAGTIAWSWGLDDLDQGLADPRIQKTTANVLDTFLRGTLPGP